MYKFQIWSVAGACLLFLVLFFGFSTKPNKQKIIEQSRKINLESTSLDLLLEDAHKNLTQDQSDHLAELDQSFNKAADDASKAVILKQLSGWWYQAKNLPVAASYAELVAISEKSDTAWSVAGASFYEALTLEKDAEKRKYCADHAVKAFESAISIQPQKVEHRVNLALIYAENPPPENPMKAVLMLKDLEVQNPAEPSVYNALGRLAIKTGQWDKAIARLEKAWSLDKRNPNTPCLLSKAYEGAGNSDKASEYATLCRR